MNGIRIAYQTTLPAALKIEPRFDQSIFVRAALNGVLREGTIAAALTALMILLFLLLPTHNNAIGTLPSTHNNSRCIPMARLHKSNAPWRHISLRRSVASTKPPMLAQFS